MSNLDDDFELDIAPVAKKKSGGSKLYIIIAAVIVLLGVGGGSAWFFLNGDDTAKPVSAAKPVQKKEPDTPKAIYVDLKEDIIVGINDATGKKHHFNVAIAVMTRDKGIETVITQHEPIIINDLVALFGAENYQALTDPEGKDALRQKALKVIQAIVKEQSGKTGVEAILFTKFVMD